MRLISIILLTLSACATVPTAQPPEPEVAPATATVSRSAQAAVDAYVRVGRQVERVAEQVCREKNPRAPRGYCDFQIKVDDSQTNAPNAYQRIGKDGRPIIAFNIPMLAAVRNEHEIAFILSHEAAHQISNHIVRSSNNANLGAALLGGLLAASGADQASVVEAQNLGGALGARAYSQAHELEADIMGTYITEIAGFDSAVGAQSFARFAGGGGFLSTHPPSNQRIAAVRRTIAKIEMDRAAGRVIRVP